MASFRVNLLHIVGEGASSWTEVSWENRDSSRNRARGRDIIELDDISTNLIFTLS